MSANWRDIQDKAVVFAHEWQDAKDEDKWAKAFWVRFFDIFGVRERSVGIFEERVKLLSGLSGKIDFFAPDKFIVEHKSKGKNLDSAFLQAANYMDALSEDEKPRYIIVSDFERFRIYDLEASRESREVEFRLADLSDNVRKFHFLTDEKVREYKEEDPINVRAVRAIGKLYEALKISHYASQDDPNVISKLLTPASSSASLPMTLAFSTATTFADIWKKIHRQTVPTSVRISDKFLRCSILPKINGKIRCPTRSKPCRT